MPRWTAGSGRTNRGLARDRRAATPDRIAARHARTALLAIGAISLAVLIGGAWKMREIIRALTERPPRCLDTPRERASYHVSANGVRTPIGLMLALVLLAGCSPAPPPEPAPEMPTYLLIVSQADVKLHVYAVHDGRDWPLTWLPPGDSVLVPLPTVFLAPGDSLRLAVLPWWAREPMAVPTTLHITRGALNTVGIGLRMRVRGRIGG